VIPRCPACNARLGAATACPRCGAELQHIFRSQRLAEQWLGVALQTTRAGRLAIAVPAVLRSLSFKQTPAAKLLHGFLIQQLYRTLYENLGRQDWQEARGMLSLLQMLQADNETLRRFAEMIAQLSAQAESNHSVD